MFTRQNGYHVPQFRATCSTAQGGITSTTLLNIVFGSVVRHWLLLIVEDRSVIQDRLEHVLGHILGVFYVHDGVLGSQDPEWL